MTGKCINCGKPVVVKWHPIWFSSLPKIRIPMYRGKCSNKDCPAYGVEQLFRRKEEA